MVDAPVMQQGRYRHARHYLNQLRIYNELFKSGGLQTIQALGKFEREWMQIRQAHVWLSKQENDLEADKLANSYIGSASDILGTQLSAIERRHWLQIGIAASERLNDQPSVVDHLVALGQAYLVTRDIPSSRTTYERALAKAQAINYQPGTAGAHVGLGRVLMLFPTHRTEARQHFQEAIQIYGQIDDLAGAAWSLHNLGTLEERQGNLEIAHQYVQEALAINQKINSLRGIAVAFSRLGSIEERRNNYDQSLEYCRASLKLARQLRDLALVSGCLQVIGLVHSLMGDNQRSREIFLEALEAAEQNGNQMYIANSTENLGFIAFESGNYTEALAYYEKALALNRTMGHPVREAISLFYIGLNLLHQGKITEAGQHFRASLALASQHKAHFECKLALFGFAWLFATRQQYVTSAEILQTLDAEGAQDVPEFQKWSKLFRPQVEAHVDFATVQTHPLETLIEKYA